MESVQRALVDVVEDERARSERYLHYFTVLMIRSKGLPFGFLLGRVQSAFRATDILRVVTPDGQCRMVGPEPEDDPIPGVDAESEQQACSVSVILPETDGGGAKAALTRFASMITAEDQVDIGMAVYPDDSTDAHELIEAARA